MATRNFTNDSPTLGGATPRPAGVDFVPADWLNDVDAAVYEGTVTDAVRAKLLGVAPVSISGTTSLTAATHANRPLLISGGTAADQLYTLPAATGTGDRYDFIVSAVTGTSCVIRVDGTAATMAGICVAATDDASDAVKAYETAATSDTITLNGGSQGGQIGDRIELLDIAANVWAVKAFVAQTGTEASPFSAGV